MGVAWLGNLAFNTIDMLMLGVMSNPQQVGLYSAAYRILNQVLMAYYLLNQSLYPSLPASNWRSAAARCSPGFFWRWWASARLSPWLYRQEPEP